MSRGYGMGMAVTRKENICILMDSFLLLLIEMFIIFFLPSSPPRKRNCSFELTEAIEFE